MQIISNIALISINATLIAQFVSFLIFVFIINRLMFRPLRKVMKERESHMDDVKNEIQEAKNELFQMRQRFKEEETMAKDEAFGETKELEQSGNIEAGRIFSDARGKIAEQKMEAEKEINSKIAASREQMKLEAETLSIAIIEKVLDRRLA